MKDNSDSRRFAARTAPAKAMSADGRAVGKGLPLTALTAAAWMALWAGGPGMLLPASAQAQGPADQAQAAVQRFSIPAGPLSSALRSLASSANLLLTFTADQTDGKTTPGISGSFTPEQALVALLAGSGLQAARLDSGGYVLRPVAPPASVAVAPGPAQTEPTLPTVHVTARTDPQQGNLPGAYAGSQMARGGRVGVLGNVDYMETPFNTSNFTRQSIENEQAISLADVVKRDPSVAIGNSRSSFSEEFQMRGFRVTGSSVLFDGLSITVPQYGVNQLHGIERVEVLKGANSMLYGNASGLTIGGAINVVPKRATDAPVTQFTGSFASDSRFGSHIDIGRRFGENNRFGIRLNAFHSNGETAFDNEHEKLGDYSLALDFRGEDARLSLDLGRQEQHTRGAIASVSADPSIPIPRPLSSGRNFAQPFNYSDVVTHFAVVKGEYDLSPAFTAYGAYGGNRSTYKQLLPFALLQNEQGDIQEVYQNGRGFDDIRTWELGLRARFSTWGVPHKAVFSAVRARFGNDGFYVFDEASGTQPTISSNLYNPLRVTRRPDLFFRDESALQPGNRNDNMSYTLADTLSFFKERFHLTLGARYQRLRSANYDTTDGSLNSSYEESAVTPSVAAVLRLTPTYSIYGNYIEALQGGPTAPDNAVNRGEVFPPSRNKQYEIGLKADFRTLGGSVALYEIEQPSGILNPVSLLFSEAGKQVNRGLELNVFGEVTRGVRVNGGIAYVAAKLRKTENGAFDGQRATAVPKYRVALAGEWDTPFMEKLTLTAGMLYSDDVEIDLPNNRRMPGFTVFDIGARYATRVYGKQTVFRAAIGNLFNKSYWVGDVWGSFYQSTPRTFLLSGTIDF